MLDAAGISLQVLSLDGSGADLLPPREGAAWAREANVALAVFVAASPDRFAGLANLPLTHPTAAAARAVRQASGVQGHPGARLHERPGLQSSEP